MRGIVLALVALGMTGAGTKPGHAQEGAESSYVQALISHARTASNLVACGDRPPAWAAHIRARIAEVVTKHAGMPLDDSDHTPSAVERDTALRSLARTEAAGQRESNPTNCRIDRQMALSDLDDIEDGATNLWPHL